MASQASLTGNALNSYGFSYGGGFNYGALMNPDAYGSANPTSTSTGTSTGQSNMIGTDVQANLISNLPNYLALSKSDSANIGNNLSGIISPDVLAQLSQGAAERGIATGSPNSDNANSAFLRALGLNSMQLQQLGHTQLTEAMNRTPVRQTSVQNTSGQQQQQQQTTGGPNPGAAAAANLAAAQAGLARGGGSVSVGGGPPGGLPMSGPGYSLPGIPAPQTLRSLGGGNDYSTPSNFNWMDWASQLPGANTDYAQNQAAQNPYDYNDFNTGGNDWYDTPQLDDSYYSGGYGDPFQDILDSLGVGSGPSSSDIYDDTGVPDASGDSYWGD